MRDNGDCLGSIVAHRLRRQGQSQMYSCSVHVDAYSVLMRQAVRFAGDLSDHAER